MILKKIHRSNNGEMIIALCDKEIKGKVITEGDFLIDTNSEFYGDDQINEDSLKKKMTEANSINAVGEKSMLFLIKNKLVDQKDIKKINNIPYVIVVLK